MADRRKNIIAGILIANVIISLIAYMPQAVPYVIIVLGAAAALKLLLKVCYQGGGRIPAGQEPEASAGPQKLLTYECRTAEDYLQRGRRKAGAGDNNGAITDFDRAVEIKPELADAYFARGYAKNDTGDFAGALEDWEKAVSLKPQFEATLRYKIETVKTRVKSKTADDWLDSGNKKLEAGDAGGAVIDFGRAIALAPGRAEVYTIRGVVKGKMGDNSGAIEDLMKAIELDPSLKPDIQPLIVKIVESQE